MDHHAADTKGGREVEREQREGMQKWLARMIKVKKASTTGAFQEIFYCSLKHFISGT